MPLAPRAQPRSLCAMDQPAAAPEDHVLMLAWAGGDATAFEALYQRRDAVLELEAALGAAP